MKAAARNRKQQVYSFWKRNVFMSRAMLHFSTPLCCCCNCVTTDAVSHLTFTGARVAGEGVANGTGAGKTAGGVVAEVAAGRPSSAFIVICKLIVILIIISASIARSIAIIYTSTTMGETKRRTRRTMLGAVTVVTDFTVTTVVTVLPLLSPCHHCCHCVTPVVTVSPLLSLYHHCCDCHHCCRH